MKAVLRQILYTIPLLLIGAGGCAYAASVQCAIQTGNSGPFVTQSCDQSLSTFTAAMSWANVLPATTGIVSGPLSGSIDGDAVTVTSNDVFGGADNTALAWTGSSWAPAGFVTNAATFAGHFNSETTPTGPSPEPVLGDSLLGILAPSGPSKGNTTVTLTFAQSLNYVEFQVSARTGSGGANGQNTNFTAELIAMDALGHVLGTYQVTDTGTGGLCAGLGNGAGPQPCDDAPFVQFYDAQDNIKSVELVMNDPTGAYIDTLEVGPIPEPASSLLIGIGILALVWLAKRGHFRRPGNLAGSTQD